MNEQTIRKLLKKYDPDWRDADIVRSNDVLLFYLELREQGNDHKLAAMFASRRTPSANTDREFFEGRGTLDSQFQGKQGERQLESIVAAARSQGYNPSPYDVYEPSLADHPGDPRAFISPAGGRTEARRKCEERGLTCHGSVKVKGRGPERPIEAGALAPDLVNEIINRQVAANPDLARVSRRDLAAEIQSKHGFTDAKRAGTFTEATAAYTPEKAAIAVTSADRKKSLSKPKRRK